MVDSTILSKLDEHEKKDDVRFEKVLDTLSEMKSNHLSHIETDITWLKWLFMGSVTGIIAILIKLFVKT